MATSIQGNTQNQAQQATTERTDNKEASYRNGASVAISFALVVTMITLIFTGVSFWGGMVGVAVLFAAAKASSDVSIISSWWPAVFKSLGWVTLAVLILNGGIGQWVGSKANNLNLTASCKTDSTQEKCKEWKAKQKAEEELRQEAARKQHLDALVYRPLPSKPDGTTSSVTVPACGDGWVKVDLPAGWSLTPAWNEAAATYQWRSNSTGAWEATPAGSVNAMRACARQSAYADDMMFLTWTKN